MRLHPCGQRLTFRVVSAYYSDSYLTSFRSVAHPLGQATSSSQIVKDLNRSTDDLSKASRRFGLRASHPLGRCSKSFQRREVLTFKIGTRKHSVGKSFRNLLEVGYYPVASAPVKTAIPKSFGTALADYLSSLLPFASLACPNGHCKGFVFPFFVRRSNATTARNDSFRLPNVSGRGKA